MKTFGFSAMGFSLVAALLVLSHSNAEAGRGYGKKDIVDTAIDAGNFETLVKAVQAAGLVETLKGPGPFTVFAPTDEAFAALPKGALDGLLKNPDALRSVLLYHVVPGKVMAADVVKSQTVRTALGQTLSVNAGSGVKIGGANVIKTDIMAGNGVIHVIDTVLLPANDVIETARAAGSFKTLLAAIEAAGLTDALRADGPFTVFAPTDEAFDRLPKGTLDKLLKDKAALTEILTYHVVPGKVTAADVVKITSARTVQGGTLTIDASSGVKINNATVVKADVGATNGVIHVIDTVLTP